MTITLDITPEAREALARQAAARGRAVEAYAASLLEDAAHLPGESKPRAFDGERAQAAGARIRELRKGVTSATSPSLS